MRLSPSVASRLRGARLWLDELGSVRWALAGLVLGATLLRLLAMFAWWPVATTLADSGVYAIYADSNPLADPQHPAGYSALLAALGVVTHKVAAYIVLQHGLGLIAALVLFAAVRRLTGSPWPGLVPAAAVLLDGDGIFLEHNIMSESAFVFVLSLSLYAGVRALDDAGRWWRWPVIAATLAVGATVIRSAGVTAIPILALAIGVGSPGLWRERWRAPAAVIVVGVVLLLGYALASSAANGRLEIGPSTGWHLYSRVAPFADCHKFTPPPGTAGLCESTPASQRSGPEYYLYQPQSPAVRMFGGIGKHDAQLGGFARAVIGAQPGDFASAVWGDIRSYYVPSSHRPQDFGGIDISPQLDWTRETPRPFTHVMIVTMDRFFSSFTQRKDRGLLEFLAGYSAVFRFGATLLTLTTILTLLGLLIGTRRARAGALLFGVGGVLQLIVPSISSLYVGRYTVPLAGPLSAAAAIATWSAWRLVREGRRVPRARPVAS